MQERKIIQIAVSESMAYHQITDDFDHSKTIIALCNDGTLWRRSTTTSGCECFKTEWTQIEDIPQPQE
ncbi:hypothetical protein BKG93_09885 [Rodentibacter ratti]|uniref:Uncharacterized protein n=1 Tax=Rodentibacter ratti TaxID=1906745 RepID=A0A1V3L0R4_9PAST|nr:hypothetical protein [Rodentibacter ratti]OOF83519.1 hypothetical protein BKG93_09885 [Rodentibacter ratti]